jgi:hypothetical protein
LEDAFRSIDLVLLDTDHLRIIRSLPVGISNLQLLRYCAAIWGRHVTSRIRVVGRRILFLIFQGTRLLVQG